MEKLANAKTALEVIGILESAPSDISDRVLSRSMNTAADVAEELERPTWRVVETLRSISVEPYAQAAKNILDSFQQALRANEHAIPLVPALHKAVGDTTRLLADVHRATAPQPSPPPPAAPAGPLRPPIGNSQMQRSKRTIAQGSTTARRQQLDSVFQEIRSKFPVTGDAEIVLSWEILSEE